MKKEISVTLFENPSDEGIKMPLDLLDNKSKYYFGVKPKKSKIIQPYLFFRFSKKDIKDEIQHLNVAGIFGEYFVYLKKRKKY